MDRARLTANGRTTIPKAIREAAGLHPGDTLAFTVEGNRIVLRRVTTTEEESWRDAVSATLTEWDSPEDEAAWRDL